MPTATPPPLYIVDAFANGPFTGNPAAVCLLERHGSPSGWPDAAWMQRLADEMNLSETAFVLPPSEAPGRPASDEASDAAFGLRWFTPRAEVELCGHATLASAHVLFTETRHAAGTVRFQTGLAGVLTCTQSSTHADAEPYTGEASAIAMDFPAQRCRPTATPPGLLEALGLDAPQVASGGVHFGPYDFLVELDTPDRVAELEPDFAALGQLECRGVAVTAAVPEDHPRAESHQPGGFHGARIVSRFFAPRLRIAEDPVTGSLHCVLATYWAHRLGTPGFTAYQASARGGLVRVTLRDERVTLSGSAVTVLRGRLSEAGTPPPYSGV
ncbi:MAG: PhzF family phenazine biosynthesis protein [Planctomycetota bacterium]